MRERLPGWSAAVLVMVGWGVSSASAQPTGSGPLTLDEVLRSAEQAHPYMNVARAKVAATRGKRTKAAGAFDAKIGAGAKVASTDGKPWGEGEVFVERPTQVRGIDLLVGWRLVGGTVPEYKRNYSTAVPGGDLFAGVSVPLLRDGPIDAGRRDLAVTRAQEQVAGQQLALTRLDLRLKAAEAYWKWVAAGLALRIDEELLKMAESRQDGLERSVKAGALARIEATENQRAIFKRQGKLISSRQKLNEAAVKLSLYLRDAEGTPLVPDASRLPGRLPDSSPPDPDALRRDLARAREVHPELRAVRLEQSAAAVRQRWAANQLTPSLDLTFGLARSLYPYTFKPKYTEAEAGVKFKWEWGRFKARGEVEQAEAELLRLDAQRRLLRDTISAEVRQAHIALDAAHQKVLMARRELDVATISRDAERERVRLGASDLLYLNIREQYVADAQRSVLEALRDFQIARARYDAACARAASGERERP